MWKSKANVALIVSSIVLIAMHLWEKNYWMVGLEIVSLVILILLLKKWEKIENQ